MRIIRIFFPIAIPLLFIAMLFVLPTHSFRSSVAQNERQTALRTEPTPLPPPSTTSCVPVIRVVDGDTLKVLIATTSESIRLIGIDTPEIVDPRRPVQCFGSEASKRMKTLATNACIMLEADASQGDRDKYGRLLRYAYLPDHTSLNEEMIREGYAFEYTYDLPYRYQAEYKVAEREARSAARGLWDPSRCTIIKEGTRLRTNNK